MQERREKVKRNTIVCLALIALFSVSVFALSFSLGGFVFASDQATADAWSMFRHDLTHSGSSSSKAPKTNQTLWKFNTGGPVDSPVVADGVVYTGSYDRNIYAFNASNGVVLWSYATGGPVLSPAAVADGLVFVGSEDHKLYALNASTGDLAWSYATGDIVVSSPAVADGVVYVGSYDHMVYAFGSSLNMQTAEFPWLEAFTVIIVVALVIVLVGSVAYRRKHRAHSRSLFSKTA